MEKMTYEIHERIDEEAAQSLGLDSHAQVHAVGVWYPIIYGIEDGRIKSAIRSIMDLEFKNPTRRYRIVEIHYQSRTLPTSTINGGEN